MTEYELTQELGQPNWIDEIAGEAVVLGHTLNDPELVALGTNLSQKSREVSFCDDRFCRVEGLALSLDNRLREIKSVDKLALFIEDIYDGDERNKPLDRWEYDLIFCEGRYQIKMLLPRYDKYTLKDEAKLAAEREVRGCYMDPSFESYKKEEHTIDYVTQVFKIYMYYDDDNKLIRRVIDHDHEGGWYRGWIDMFYFDDFETAWNAWTKVKAATSGRRRSN